VWIEGLVVFAHPRTELQADHSRVPAVLLEQTTARICGHTPRRWLQPAEVTAVLEALLEDARVAPKDVQRQSAQALVEMALLVPLVLALVFGIVAVSRLVQAQTAVVAVAHEAARAGALARTPQDAIERMHERAALVAPGFGLDTRKLAVECDVTRFTRDPGEVVAIVRYGLDFHELPLVGWLPPPAVHAEHVEWVDPFRSGAASVAPQAPVDEH